METIDYEKRTLMGFIGIIISTFKWVSLILFVFNIGLTIGLSVMTFIHGLSLPDNIVANMIELMTYYSHSEIMHFIEVIGKEKVLIAGFASGIAYTLNYGLLYMIFSKIKTILIAVKKENMFKKSIVKLTRDLVPLSFILTFAQPLILYWAHRETSMFELNDLNVSGILFLIIAYVLNLIFEKGHRLQLENEKFEKKLLEYKEIEEEKKIDNLKEEIRSRKKSSSKKKDATKKASKGNK